MIQIDPLVWVVKHYTEERHNTKIIMKNILGVSGFKKYISAKNSTTIFLLTSINFLQYLWKTKNITYILIFKTMKLTSSRHLYKKFKQLFFYSFHNKLFPFNTSITMIFTVVDWLSTHICMRIHRLFIFYRLKQISVQSQLELY